LKPAHFAVTASLALCFAARFVSAAEFDAASFGAVPGDGKDDRPALQAALSKAAASAGSRLRIRPGVYHLDSAHPDKKEDAVLFLSKAKDLVIDGKGAEMIVRCAPVGFLRAMECDGLTVRGLTVDYDPTPFLVGEVLEVFPDEDAFAMRLLPGYPPADHPMFSGPGQWGYFLDPKVPGRLLDGMPNVVFREVMSVEGDGRVRVQLAKGAGGSIRSLRPGAFATQLARYNQFTLCHNSRRVRFEGITSYASTSGHFVASDVEDYRVENCRALIREGRHKGGNADGVHLQNVRGPIVIRGCTFDGISDDAVNLYQKPHYIIGRKGPTKWTFSSNPGAFAKRSGAGVFRVGDTLRAFDDTAGADYGSAKLVAYDPATGEGKLDAGWNVPEDPAAWAGICVYGDGFGSDFAIENNTFRHSRRYGLYFKSHRGRATGNRFVGLSSSAVFASNDTTHKEGGFCGGLVIADNEILDCGFEGNFLTNKTLGMITFEAIREPHRPIDLPALHRDITLRGNKIAGCPRGFVMANTEGLVIEGNTFTPAKDAAPPDEFPVTTRACDRVRAENNRVLP
jgi:hypothetical protein